MPSPSAALLAAATAPTTSPLDLLPLPAPVLQLLVEVAAPPRLVAHLRAVHDVAARIVVALPAAWPALVIDVGAVSFGAATHDIGKALHTGELIGPGHQHEGDGHDLLLARGIAPEKARFARTHARWNADDATFEDLLVTLADKVWKGRREEDLERQIVGRIASVTRLPPWEVFMRLDEILEDLAALADHRLAFQDSY
jgi:hypothetical protein